MALIPPDAGVRLRLQTDLPTPAQPVGPLPEIPADLPELQIGQAFTARIQETLPQNTYKALVAGKFVTLQLPEGAKPGDTLELVVIDRTPRAFVAQLAGQPAQQQALAEAYPHATLSPAAQLIGSLLPSEGETPQPAPLNRGQPLLEQPPVRGSDLAPALAKAVAQSGVFYEAHQAQWVAGQRPIEQLLLEPQALTPQAATLARHSQPGGTNSPEEPAVAERRPAPPSLLQTLFGKEEKTEGAAVQSQSSSLAHAVPQELRPIVQQQLDAVATLRLVWHGEAWPNQPLEWEIVREDEQRAAADAGEEQTHWRTRLRLDTPRLGHVDASLLLTPDGVRMSIATPIGATAADLQEAAPELAAALEAAGVPLLSFTVKHESAE
ncbi:MAG TPA: flagellar hook-length control protein FliK [Rhodocyclaceae bacterium]